MVGRKVRDAGEAVEMLAAVAAAGVTRVDWARSNGIDARSLNMWRLVLNRRGRPQPPALRFVELVPVAAPAANAIVVRCGTFAVEVSGGIDDDLLRRVLVAVAASC